MKAKVEVRENQLQVIVKESGLDSTKAKYILEKFQDYFAIADEWTIKARTIKVTNESQVIDMEMARVGRLFLKEKRCAIETVRKELKEQALREGKAIDGIANVLKALIVPIEEYLEHQEKFVEIQEEAKREAKRLEIEARMAEEERIALEKAAAEQKRLRLENERLKKEAEARECKIMAERKEQEKLLAVERAKADSLAERVAIEVRQEREKIELAAKVEREKRDKELAKERAKVEGERKEAEEKTRKEKEKQQTKLEAERKEKLRLEELLKNQITCPKCGHKFQLNKK